MTIKDMRPQRLTLKEVNNIDADITIKLKSTFLRYTLAQGKYQLHDEMKVLKQRADSRTRMKWLESGAHLEEAP